ncbi:hypothetical protein [Candidatus Babela massiliensis]|uniref:Uncharacterized protein n=1 Tax=Candidatus Babela massiliensis TaxID=673862 RepID=V6DIF8_9BACT|nr:hypothetical protein [Candidatus Babela massiliensis]CDK30713.1 hypothetical protein BABL1_gene_302 [Candidatus Babela massiliensis]
MNSLKKIMLIGSLLTLLTPIYGADNVLCEQMVEQNLFQKDKIGDLILWAMIGIDVSIFLHLIFRIADFHHKDISDKFKNLKDKFHGNKNTKLKNYAKMTAIGTAGVIPAILVYKNLNNIMRYKRI